MSYNKLGVQTTNLKTAVKTDLSISELQQKCNTCFITNPMACKEMCEVWKLKQEYASLRKEIPEKIDAITLMGMVANRSNLKILNLLNGGSTNIKDLIKVQGDSYSNVEFNQNLENLIKAGLIQVNNGSYNITSAGQKTLKSLQEYTTLEKIDELNGRLTELLIQGMHNIDELRRNIPQRELNKAIEQLKAYGVIEKTSGRNQVLYFATKRRPTRKLSSVELSIFKSLPKDGISANELSKKLDLTLPCVYRYLRLLRYKRHAFRRKQNITFKLTPIGIQIAEAFQKVKKIIEGLSLKEFA